MIQHTVSLPAKARIVFLGDSHIGHPGFREDILEDLISEIKSDPNCYFIGLGDYIEGRPPGHKFYDPSSPMNVGEQYKYFFDKIRPIKNKCLGLHIGNHEFGTIQQTTINPVRDFCVDNNIVYLGDIGRTIVKLANSNKTFTIVTAHGAGGGMTVGANLNKIINWGMSTFTDVDAIVVGHYHKLATSVELSGYINKEGLQRWGETYVILNGAMLEAYHDGSEGSYVEKNLMRPSVLGYAELKLNPKGKVNIELHPY